MTRRSLFKGIFALAAVAISKPLKALVKDKKYVIGVDIAEGTNKSAMMIMESTPSNGWFREEYLRQYNFYPYIDNKIYSMEENMQGRDTLAPINTKDSSSPSIRRGACGSDNWRQGGTTDPKEAISNSPQKNPIDPKTNK